jgi:Tol biopolymer transport system component
LDGRTGPPIVENDGAAQRTGARPVVSHITFSPDGKHLAFDQQRVQGANRGVVYHYHHVNLDGLEGKEYARIYGITFSPDGRALAYSAYDIMGGVDSTPRGWLTVLGNKEGPVYESVLAPVFSPDSQHYAYAARKDGHWLMVLDGHEIGQYVPIVSEAFGRSNVIDDHFPSPYRFDSDDKLVFLGLSDGRILRVICKPNANSALRQ